MGTTGSSKWLGLAVGLCLIGACGGASSKSDGSSSTQPSVAISSSTTSIQPTTTSTVSAVKVPEGLPRFVVASVTVAPAIDGRTLIALELRTGKQIALVSPANPPPLLSDDPWVLSGFDVSPDGRFVAFGVVSLYGGRSSKAPPTTAAAIYLEPIDGSSAAKRVRVITGPRPEVFVARFSPDGKWLLGGTDKWTIWPVSGGAPMVSDVYSPYGGAGIQWSPDGTRIAYGEHYERNMAPVTSMLRFDAEHHTLTHTSVRNGSGTIPGTDPWFSRDGVLHVITDRAAACNGPQDVDSSFRWGLSLIYVGCSGIVSNLTFWDTATRPQKAQQLALALPQIVHGVAW